MSNRDGLQGKLVDNLGTIIPPTSEQISQAQRYVSARATGADDLRLLFSMLGIGEAA